MPWRFQRVLRIFPWLRLNLSKGGISTSAGPRGASVNIGKHGVTTSAGVPGTGLSYRQRLGKPGTWIGIVLFVVAMAWANRGPLLSMLHSATAPPGATTSAPAAGSTATAPPTGEVAASGIRYVRRGNTNLRSGPSNSAGTLKKMAKGTQVTLLAVSGAWSKVQDGATVGWMRSSVLGETAPDSR